MAQQQQSPAVAGGVTGGGGGGGSTGDGVGSRRSSSGQFGDTSLTKIFVGGLAWETQCESMRQYFQQFGDIVEAVVIRDKHTGRSKGYGFVTFRDPQAARRACADPAPIIDGRRANCNLAALGANRPRFSPSLPRGRFRPGSPYTGGQHTVAGAAQPFAGSPTFGQPIPYSFQQGLPYPPFGYPPYPPEFYPPNIYNPFMGAQMPAMFGGSGLTMYPPPPLSPSVHGSPAQPGFGVPSPAHLFPYGGQATISQPLQGGSNIIPTSQPPGSLDLSPNTSGPSPSPSPFALPFTPKGISDQPSS